jgi:hypothetical protein
LKRGAKQVFEPLREQVHAAAHAVRGGHVDELDVWQGQVAHAAGKREQVVLLPSFPLARYSGRGTG